MHKLVNLVCYYLVSVIIVIYVT